MGLQAYLAISVPQQSNFSLPARTSHTVRQKFGYIIKSLWQTDTAARHCYTCANVYSPVMNTSTCLAVNSETGTDRRNLEIHVVSTQSFWDWPMTSFAQSYVVFSIHTYIICMHKWYVCAYIQISAHVRMCVCVTACVFSWSDEVQIHAIIGTKAHDRSTSIALLFLYLQHYTGVDG
jgi:hypothetical protein